MKHFLKGAAVVAAVLMVLMGINIFCNVRGIDLNSTGTGTVAAICSMWIYDAWIRNEKKDE